MGSDTQWYWTSDYGRDKMLREQLESQSYAASAATARLRSQLAKVQGSLDQRLTALTKAFDAYVELGDVREELSRLPSSLRVRDQARGAMSSLRSGATPEPVTDDGSGHWLGPAMNRVIAVVRGEADPGLPNPDGPGVPRSGPDAGIFVAAALASLGRGAAVADLVPTLLITDGGFTTEQVLLFAATVRGRFGPDALAAARPMLGSSLASIAAMPVPAPEREAWRAAPEELAEWPAWLTSTCGASKVLTWVLDRTRPVAVMSTLADDATAGATRIEVAGYDPARGSETAPAGEDLDAQLRTLVDQMIAEGSPQERKLLRRSAELRARIENPGVAQPPTRWDVPPQPVAAIVRSQLRDLPADDPGTRELLRWVLPLVQPAIDEAIAAEPAREPVMPLRASAAGSIVEVTADGAVPASRSAALARIESAHARPPLDRAKIIGAVAVGVIGSLLVVVNAATGVAIGWLGVIGLLVAAGLTGAAFWQHRLGNRPELARQDVAALESAVTKAQERAKSAQQARDLAQQDHRRLVELVTAQLAEFRDGTTQAGPERDRPAPAVDERQ